MTRNRKGIVSLLRRLTRAYQLTELMLAEPDSMDSIEAVRYLPLFEEKNRWEHFYLVFLAHVRELINHHSIALSAGFF